MYHIYLIICLFNYLIQLSYQISYQGDATTYGGSRIGGSCGFTNAGMNIPKYPYGVAINSNQYNNSLSCGSCINIQYNNKNLDVIVTDICPKCAFGDLDLFQESYQKLISNNPSREKIQWEFINCPNTIISDNIQLVINEINYYWVSIQPINIKCEIYQIFILQNDIWVLMERDDSKMMGLFFIYNQKLLLPFKFKLINQYLEEIITPSYNSLENLYILDTQFKCLKEDLDCN
jgi:expansin (peptidoglycan-binding protein)